MKNLVDTHIIQEIIDGRCSDPFSVLGMHETKAGVEVRSFIPNAKSVAVIDKKTNKKVATLELVHPDGFFSAVVAKKDKFDYKLKIFWQDSEQTVEDHYSFMPMFQELDNWLFGQGNYLRPYEKLGAHPTTYGNIKGVVFAVWAPNAKRVSVVGDFNFWDGRRHLMRRHGSGVWEVFIPDIKVGTLYKYELLDANNNIRLKADPYAFASELRPETASKVANLPKKVPMTAKRKKANDLDQPISIYEVHLGSWRRNLENNYWLTYDELAQELVEYVKDMGFTHIELLPITEYPFDGSWGYQPTGMYSPTSRFGDAEGFKKLVAAAHKAGINVILDWVPGHFPSDSHGLATFDGTHLYEHSDPREGYHQDWNTLIYNYGRYEVKNFLSANALYWLECYGLDGIRVDAVASMIYRNYSRKDGEWVANIYGGHENLEAIEFLKHTNSTIGVEMQGATSIAEESTSFAGITLPPDAGGLGFNYKWNMGWMNDALKYMKRDSIYRKYHHNELTFGMIYNYSENFVLPLSHDEVVHGKGSMLDKMPGDTWQKFANLRAFYGYMWAYPGKKLLFMGNEFAQGREWNYQESLDWYLLEERHGGGWHKGVQSLVRDLNNCYKNNSALYQLDVKPEGFEWLVVDDHDNSILAFERKDLAGKRVIVVSNFTPNPHYNYRFGVNLVGAYKEILNTDSEYYRGSNLGNLGQVLSEEIPSHNKENSIAITIPPLATIYLEFDGEVKPTAELEPSTKPKKAAAKTKKSVSTSSKPKASSKKKEISENSAKSVAAEVVKDTKDIVVVAEKVVKKGKVTAKKATKKVVATENKKETAKKAPVKKAKAKKSVKTEA